MNELNYSRCFSWLRSCKRASAFLLACAFLLVAGSVAAQSNATIKDAGQWRTDASAPASVCAPNALGSPFVPVDSWVYPAMMRLYSLGYVDSVFLGIRPWTRASISHILEETSAKIEDDDNGPGHDEAQEIYLAIQKELNPDSEGPCLKNQGNTRLESVYSAERFISGTPLRDSFHLGSTVVNDYGRPYTKGFNDYTGASAYAGLGRFLLYYRGEFQGAPSANGYSLTLYNQLAALDTVTDFFNTNTPIPYTQNATIPAGPIATATNARVMEAYLSGNLIGHIISFGKQDEWLGPGQGGAMSYSNNAENIYALHINRIEPLSVPFLSRVTGPFRYEFLVGSLKGHVYPNDPWVHVEKISLKPLPDLEFGFERTVIWGGKGHEAINLHTFLRSFFSLVNVSGAVKNSNLDPGARFGAFDFTWRLPYLQKWLTLYSDSEAHDDVSPIDAPRRASYRPGLYLSHVPGLAKLDLRAEGISTDPPTTRSIMGLFNYNEGLQRQGYTNKGQIFGDWIGREAKGGQAWATWHLSGNEWIEAGFRHQKAAKDFIPGGTSINDFNFKVVKRLRPELELNANFAYERWLAPIYPPGSQTVTTTNIQLTWFPQRKISF